MLMMSYAIGEAQGVLKPPEAPPPPAHAPDKEYNKIWHRNPPSPHVYTYAVTMSAT